MREETLQQMDDQAFLGKVDKLFEWLRRQAGDGPIEGWTLGGIQGEIRCRIMERNVAAALCTEPVPVQLRIESETYFAGGSQAKLALRQAIFSRGGLQIQVVHGLSRHEADLLLDVVKCLTSLGILFEELPAPFRFC